MYDEDLDLDTGATPWDWYLLRIPAGTHVDGAVVELARDDRRTVTAGIRTPGPAVK
jgi:hypothetical protein